MKDDLEFTMKDYRGELDMTKQIEDKDELIKELRKRVNELMAINKSHQQLMGKQIVENKELKEDNKRLAKQIDDYFNVRVKAARDNAG
jgi:hypothetical protein|tara:strand:+ start:454 stop:717 length:264 start_codon:yes stop_codon:yes gene_type:complete